MWSDPEWFICQLEVWIWFWSLAPWCPTFLYLTFSTLYSSSLWRTDTIVLSKWNKPLLSNTPAAVQENESSLIPSMELSSGRIKDQTREMAEIEPNRAANLNSTLSKTLDTVRTYTGCSFSMGVCLVAVSQQKGVTNHVPSWSWTFGFRKVSLKG